MDNLEQHYRENYGLLTKRLNARCGSMQDAEDIIQEAYLKAIRFKEQCSGEFDNWFSVILRNTTRDFVSTRRMNGMSRNIDDHGDELPAINTDHMSISAKQQITKMIKNKSSLARETLTLSVFFGYTPAEISFLLQTNRTTIYSYIRDFNLEVSKLGK